MNAPEKVRAVSEALSRDADAVEDATNVTQTQPQPPPSLKGLLGTGALPPAKKLNGYANGHTSSVANGTSH